MFAVAMALWLRADADDGTRIFPSAETVGTQIGASRKSVGKYRTALVELGMIELISQGKGTGDSSVYRLREPSQWRNFGAEFDAAMAATPKPVPKPETPAASPERERVRAVLQGAPNRNVLEQIRYEWPDVIEPDAALNALYGTRRAEFQRKDNR